MKSKETINQLSSLDIACYPLYKMHWLLCICVCSWKHSSSWVVAYIHGCTNEHTFSIKSTRFNPCFGSNNYSQHKLAKVGLNLLDVLENVCTFVHPRM